MGISLIEDLNKQLSICHLESFDVSSISKEELYHGLDFFFDLVMHSFNKQWL